MTVWNMNLLGARYSLEMTIEPNAWGAIVSIEGHKPYQSSWADVENMHVEVAEAEIDDD